MRKRKSGMSRRGIGFPLILAGVAAWFFIQRLQQQRIARLTSGYENVPRF